jgi:hypothetical protein
MKNSGLKIFPRLETKEDADMGAQVDEYFQKIQSLIGYAAEVESLVLSRYGQPLTALQLADARLVGVREPGRIRLANSFAFIKADPRLNTLLNLGGPELAGLTIGHAIILSPDRAEDLSVFLHECAHVSQYEKLGLNVFLRQYFSEYVRYGYAAMPLEKEALAAVDRVKLGCKNKIFAGDNSQRGVFSLLLSALLFSGNALQANANIVVKHCTGVIRSDFETLHVDAQWNVEWPEQIDGVSTNVLARIQQKIGYDAFIEPFRRDNDKLDKLHYERPDFAQALLFRDVREVVEAKEDTYSARSIDFVANLKIKFVNRDYLGYRLNGYQNEGGCGCHVYTVARVISLSTGRCLCESEFISTNIFPALGNFIVRKICATRKLKAFEPANLANVFNNGNFIFEEQGIRWYLPPYSAFPGCDGVQNALLTWNELKPFVHAAGRLKDLSRLNFGSKQFK